MAFTGIGSGLAIEELKTVNPPVHTYYPGIGEVERNERIDSWCYAAQRTAQWHPER
jgi:hypothetical protein